MSKLIIGGDSRLGKVLCSYLRHEKDADKVFKTTRRQITLTPDQIYLNLPDIENFQIPEDIDAVAFIGGVTSYDECNRNPDYAYKVNCSAIPELAERFLSLGIYVCFISTNTVFKCDFVPREDTPVCPGFRYAKLKAITEAKLQETAERLGKIKNLSILRLTKNISIDTSPFGSWLEAIRDNKPIQAFNDLYFAPIRFVDSAMAIQMLLKTHQNGIFHLSGERDVSYYEFAVGLCEHLGIDSSLILDTKSTDLGVKLAYNHPITALDMSYTHQALGLSPIPLTTIYSHLQKHL